MNALFHIRDPRFYEEYAVPDTFEGRFDLLLLHLFVLMNRCVDEADGQSLSQALFDAAFRNMDQTLREMGVGDVGIPKRMKKLMLACNGRMHAYRAALRSEDPQGEMAQALQRNLYAGLDITGEKTGVMARYVMDLVNDLQQRPFEALTSGRYEFGKV